MKVAKHPSNRFKMLGSTFKEHFGRFHECLKISVLGLVQRSLSARFSENMRRSATVAAILQR